MEFQLPGILETLIVATILAVVVLAGALLVRAAMRK
jgi:hypothetical protein